MPRQMPRQMPPQIWGQIPGVPMEAISKNSRRSGHVFLDADFLLIRMIVGKARTHCEN